MPNLREQLKAVKKRLEKQIHEKVEMAAEILGENLVLSSDKIDTGLYAANWHPATDKIRRDDSTHESWGIPEYLIGPIGTNDRLISESEALEVATNIPPFKLGQTIFFSNSVPYVSEIDGYSDAWNGAEDAKEEANWRINR